MKANVVVDVGNSRIKWGLCGPAGIKALASLPHEEPALWEKQIAEWELTAPSKWVVTGVHPQSREQLVDWLRQRGDQVVVLKLASDLPLEVALEHPDKVGIDRLLDAVAALSVRKRSEPIIVIDAGSAVTVDWVNTLGEFCGGTIFPGIRLMALALHDYTALLPVVDISEECPSVPGTSTIAAMQAGIYWAVIGGIQVLIDRLCADSDTAPLVFLTGGDAGLLAPALDRSVRRWPEMTLEGLRITAEHQ
jgi:type III pantothenate kinase